MRNVKKKIKRMNGSGRTLKKVKVWHRIKPLKGYRFINKDPVIDKIRTLKADSGMTSVEIEKASGVKASTFDGGWFNGSTRRPQHATVAAVAGAMGYDFVIVKKK
jgi:hypothetical protein